MGNACWGGKDEESANKDPEDKDAAEIKTKTEGAEGTKAEEVEVKAEDNKEGDGDKAETEAETTEDKTEAEAETTEDKTEAEVEKTDEAEKTEAEAEKTE